MKKSDDIVEISKAMNKLQAELNNISKEAKGYNYKYADFASIWDALRHPLTHNGLSVTQDAISSNEGVSVTTHVLHTSGQWLEFGPLLVPMGKRDAHSTGSAISYARRYGLSAAVGIVPDDDDGKKAQAAAPKQHKLCTPQEFEDFVDAWSNSYPEEKVREFIQKKSSYESKGERETVYELITDQKSFENKFKNWLSKNGNETTVES